MHEEQEAAKKNDEFVGGRLGGDTRSSWDDDAYDDEVRHWLGLRKSAREL
jgi:hypothetical protein